MMLERAGLLSRGRITRKLLWSMYGPSLGMFSAGIAIDTKCASNLPVLYAAGDAAAKMAAGTSDAAGALPFALVSGIRAGISAASHAHEIDEPDLDEGEVRRLKAYVLGPLGRADGVEGDYVIEALQDVVIPFEVLMLRKGDRMKQALQSVLEIQEELLPLLYAHDPHYLRLACEARSLVLAAEIALRAGLERTESRANIREDYPYVDDINWLKWVRVRQDAHQMRIWADDVPVNRYPVRPKRERYLHPCLQMAKRRGIVKGIADAGVVWA
jgi:succinate dehydrogenase/fumarate reductase flavoprotein subunit